MIENIKPRNKFLNAARAAGVALSLFGAGEVMASEKGEPKISAEQSVKILPEYKNKGIFNEVEKKALPGYLLNYRDECESVALDLALKIEEFEKERNDLSEENFRLKMNRIIDLQAGLETLINKTRYAINYYQNEQTMLFSGKGEVVYPPDYKSYLISIEKIENFSKFVPKYLETMGIKILEAPAFSPDENPII